MAWRNGVCIALPHVDASLLWEIINEYLGRVVIATTPMDMEREVRPRRPNGDLTFRPSCLQFEEDDLLFIWGCPRANMLSCSLEKQRFQEIENAASESTIRGEVGFTFEQIYRVVLKPDISGSSIEDRCTNRKSLDRVSTAYPWTHGDSIGGLG